MSTSYESQMGMCPGLDVLSFERPGRDHGVHRDFVPVRYPRYIQHVCCVARGTSLEFPTENRCLCSEASAQASCCQTPGICSRYLQTISRVLLYPSRTKPDLWSVLEPCLLGRERVVELCASHFCYPRYCKKFRVIFAVCGSAW